MGKQGSSRCLPPNCPLPVGGSREVPRGGRGAPGRDIWHSHPLFVCAAPAVSDPTASAPEVHSAIRSQRRETTSAVPAASHSDNSLPAAPCRRLLPMQRPGCTVLGSLGAMAGHFCSRGRYYLHWHRDSQRFQGVSIWLIIFIPAAAAPDAATWMYRARVAWRHGGTLLRAGQTPCYSGAAGKLK